MHDFEDFESDFIKCYPYCGYIIDNKRDIIKNIFKNGKRFAIINKYHKPDVIGAAYKYILSGKILDEIITLVGEVDFVLKSIDN